MVSDGPLGELNVDCRTVHSFLNRSFRMQSGFSRKNRTIAFGIAVILEELQRILLVSRRPWRRIYRHDKGSSSKQTADFCAFVDNFETSCVMTLHLIREFPIEVLLF